MNFVMLILQDGSTTKNQILAKKLGIVVVRRKDFQPNKNVKNVNASDLGLGMAFDNNFNQVWGTFFGGARIDEGNAVAVDNLNNKLYVTGWTTSQGGVTTPFPLTDFIPGTSYYQDQVNGNDDWVLGSDGFVARFDLSSVVGIEELLDDGSTIGVFPNPSSDIFNININLSNSKKQVVITVFDVIGKSVYTETIKNPTTQINKSINLTSFSKGVYVLNIQLDDDVLSKKLIKQ